MPRFLTSVFFFCAAFLLTACDDQHAPQQQETDAAPYIVAVNNPLLYFAERLAGGKVEVRLLAPAAGDPATWQPNVAEALQLQQAALVLLNGAGYSSWLNKVSLSSHKLVVTSAAEKSHWIPMEKQVTHSHGPQGEHAHGDYAFTTWMDMSMAQVQAQSVADAISRTWPARREQVERNLTALLSDLQALDAAYSEWVATLVAQQVIYSHPVYQYFERRYDLPGYSLHWEPDEMPDETQWQELADLATENTIFVWEAAPTPAIAERLQNMGIDQVTIDPGANSSDIDWLTLQRQNVNRLQHR